jgi:antitoxin CcdA
MAKAAVPPSRRAFREACYLSLLEKQRRLLLSAAVIACRGSLQREAEIIPLIAEHMIDASYPSNWTLPNRFVHIYHAHTYRPRGIVMAKSKIEEAGNRRRPTNVTLPVDLVNEAKELRVNVSQACESGLARSVAEARRARWLEDNEEAFRAHSEMIEREGLILDEFRQF